MSNLDLFGPTVAEARENLLAKLPEGCHCPVCGKWNHADTRSLNSTMARSLIWLCGESYARRAALSVVWGDGPLTQKLPYVDVPKVGPAWIQRTKQHTSLRWWGLVERQPKSDDPKKKHSGLWRPTVKGWEFAHGQCRVPKKVITWKGEVLGFSDASVNVRDCLLGSGFDYSEAMSLAFMPR